eukprot:6315346-Prorocentrum_lima.AAC.1
MGAPGLRANDRIPQHASAFASSSACFDGAPSSAIRPWWPGQESEAFHTQTRLSVDRKGLLIDIGAYDNLIGDHWLQRVRAHADKAGRKTVVREQAGLNS